MQPAESRECGSLVRATKFYHWDLYIRYLAHKPENRKTTEILSRNIGAKNKPSPKCRKIFLGREKIKDFRFGIFYNLIISVIKSIRTVAQRRLRMKHARNKKCFDGCTQGGWGAAASCCALYTCLPCVTGIRSSANARASLIKIKRYCSPRMPPPAQAPRGCEQRSCTRSLNK